MPIYQIRLKEQLGQHWSSWFDEMVITIEANGETVLTGQIIDQAALHGLLNKVRDLQLTLLAVYPLEDGSSERKAKEQNSPQESC